MTEETIPGVDPYLTWAQISDFKDYEEGRFQVVVEIPKGSDPPWTVDETARKRHSPIEICQINERTKVYTGTLQTKDDLEALLERARTKKDVSIEFNQPRFNPGMVFGGSDVENYAEKPKLKSNVIAVIDHGCPFAHQQFLIKNSDDKWESRVRHLWDQDIALASTRLTDHSYTLESFRKSWWFGVKEFAYGSELTTQEMTLLIESCTKNGEIDEAAVYASAKYETMESRATHGGGVLDLAAGCINPMTEKIDAASHADIIFVQLPRATVADTSGGSMTKYVLDALKYIFDLTPNVTNLVINLSFGSSAGPHDGSSLLERSMDQLIITERANRKDQTVDLVLPAGNHYLAQGHTFFEVGAGKGPTSFKWQTMPDDQTTNFLEMWYPQGSTGVKVNVTSPSALMSAEASCGQVARLKRNGEAIGTIVHSNTAPNGKGIVALVALGPTGADTWAKVEHGAWTVTVSSDSSNLIPIHAWVERDDALVGAWRQPQSFIISPLPGRLPEDNDDTGDTVKRVTTGNSLAHGTTPIVVGAYVKSSLTASDYSGSGPNLNGAVRWPAGVAVGDVSVSVPGILVAGTYSGSLVRLSGTSVAAPQVAREILNSRVAGSAFPKKSPKGVAAILGGTERTGSFSL